MQHSNIAKSLVMFLMTLIFSCSDPLEEANSIHIKTVTNQVGTKKAILFEDEGNATVDNFLFVSVYNSAYSMTGKERGNTFSVDRNHSATGLDSTSINMTWISPDTLQIDYDKKLRTFMQNKSVNNVVIVYKPR